MDENLRRLPHQWWDFEKNKAFKNSFIKRGFLVSKKIMKKIRRTIYLDESVVRIYEDLAKIQGKSFSAIIRETLEKYLPEIKKLLNK